MSLLPGATLGPYRIVGQLGAGGMGVVYQAHDPRLDRHVAIKLLPPDLTRDDTAKQRFLQEAKAASALDHPNICTIYDIAESDDGRLYLVMAHYEGETLKERISRGPLELNDAIDVATQVGEGLTEAHKAGIVHRDIKPANLMVTTDGTVKILDFGLAKLAGSDGVTQTGTTVGTVAYMSPEQARGQEVDHRTDIWSLGVVLYEMLAGELPFQGENLAAIVHGVLERDLRPLAGTSASLQPVVGKALSKVAAQRYQAVSALLSDLKNPSSHAVRASEPTQADSPSIAVLPFDDMSPAKDQAYFCEGMAEEIINALTTLDGLRVASRTSAFQAKARDLDMTEIGARLKVGAILEGSVRKAGERLRVTAQLINVGDGYHLWSERFDRTMDDIFEVQDEIARSVVGTLKVKLLGVGDSPLVRRPTDDLEAYNLYLEAQHHWQTLTREGLTKSLACFERALSREPGFAQAHAGKGWVYVAGAHMCLAPPRDLIPKAKDAALRALDIDDGVAQAHYVMAKAKQTFDWDWAGAAQAFQRALEANPSDAEARSHYAMLLFDYAGPAAAVREARRAVEDDPVHGLVSLHFAHLLLAADQSGAAIEEARRNIALNPTFFAARWALAGALVAEHRPREAVEALRQGRDHSQNDPMLEGMLGWALARVGEDQEADAIARQLEALCGTGYSSAVAVAVVHAGLGDDEQTFKWLSRAYDERDSYLCYLKSHHPWRPLHSDPRFRALLRKMNYPEATGDQPSASA